jgi:hypothetical protein
MSLRFQADADFNHKIIAGLRRMEPAMDIQTSDEAMLRGRPDPEVLAYCASANRLLLTHDGRTMPLHFAHFIEKQESPGVVIVSQAMRIRTAIDRILEIWSDSTAEEWVNGIRRF